MDGSHLNSSLGGFHAPTPLSGYGKLKLGWATYEAINSDGPIIFPSLDETDRICVRFINDSNPNDWDEGEYFFFDNRRPLFTNGNRTFDGDMMNGLLIWHHAKSNFSHNGLRFDVEEANGLDQVGDGIGSARNDHLFPGTAGNYTAFTPYTNPNSNKKDGTRSGFALTCIKVNGSGSSAYVTANAYLNFYTGSWSGNVTTNTAWGGTVTVTTNVTVNSGVTLTIDPGSVIQFQSGTSLTVNGRLVADSNDPTRRITFTGTTATPGFWNYIIINANTNGTITFGSRLLKVSDFPASGYKAFNVPFNLNPPPAPVPKFGVMYGAPVSAYTGKVNVRAYWHGLVTTFLDYVTIQDSVTTPNPALADRWGAVQIFPRFGQTSGPKDATIYNDAAQFANATKAHGYWYWQRFIQDANPHLFAGSYKSKLKKIKNSKPY
ncbi:MAG: hypothetical protein ACRENG_11730 [bacterium]